jgi:hypothetical protein
MSTNLAATPERDSLTERPAEHELKYALATTRVPAVLAWLHGVCEADPVFPRGVVSSIYYDERDLGLLFEKLNSDFLKTKVRLRWYADPATPEEGGPAFLEAKFRCGAIRDKVRVPTEFRGSWLSRLPLDDPRLVEIPRRLRGLGCLVSSSLVPVITIRYERHRFIEPASRARVSLDFDIHVVGVNHAVVPSVAPVALRTAVMEIKGPFDEAPPALAGLTAFGSRRASFSKYGVCCLQALRVSL